MLAVRIPQLQKRTMIKRNKSTMPDNVLEYSMSICLKNLTLSRHEKRGELLVDIEL
jgi:hypothetical protein